MGFRCKTTLYIPCSLPVTHIPPRPFFDQSSQTLQNRVQFSLISNHLLNSRSRAELGVSYASSLAPGFYTTSRPRQLLARPARDESLLSSLDAHKEHDPQSWLTNKQNGRLFAARHNRCSLPCLCPRHNKDSSTHDSSSRAWVSEKKALQTFDLLALVGAPPTYTAPVEGMFTAVG
jgi:hypothetical protein